MFTFPLLPVFSRLSGLIMTEADVAEKAFHAFTSLHLAVVLACLLGCFLTVRAGLLLRREPDAERFFRRILAAGMTLFFLWYIPYELRPSAFRLDYSLPLQFCDFAWIPCAVALWTGGKRAQTLAYFWGLVLSSQGLIQPVITDGPTTVHFWTFFTAHYLMVSSGIYLVIVNRYRPRFSSYIFAVSVTFLITACLFIFNIIFYTNYAYVGNSKPETPTLLDLLGSWPLRALYVALLGVVVFFLVYIPWPLASFLRKRFRQRFGKKPA